MPLYEYRCARCDRTIEVLQGAGAPDPATCGDDCALEGPERGVGALSRVLSVTGGYAMGASKAAAAPAPEMCGTCGMAPGSCQA
ncbi:MAG: zinc ribbon domain-containing protein [Alphaproteobacteria bacterium]|nr:zinc ribbon domain-containing protein [Alphaproteobacteria bacterium]